MAEAVPKHRRVAYRVAVIGLLLLFAGCAAGVSNSNSDNNNNKNGEFYGGASGGWSHL